MLITIFSSQQNKKDMASTKCKVWDKIAQMMTFMLLILFSCPLHVDLSWDLLHNFNTPPPPHPLRLHY